MKRESAETLALEALAWLAGNAELMPLFFNATGTSADDVKDRAEDPVFLGSVLDFILMDDAWIMAFCDAAGHPYDRPMTARGSLPGGDLPHWT